MHPGEGLAGPAGVADRQLRLLALAALASLGLHALVFTILPMLREAYTERPSPPPLKAQLAKQKPPPEPPRAEPPPPPPAPGPRQVTRPQPRVAPKPVPPQPAPVLSMEPAKPAAEPPAFAVAPAPAVAPSAPSATARTEPPPAAVAGPDPGSLARFRLELMEIARRYKRYPRIAQDNNWEGRVELRVAFGESGAMSALTVRRSAGRTVLDEEAQSMIRSALPQVAVPPALRGKAFALDVAVDFSLKDER
jgi:TonB family protein